MIPAAQMRAFSDELEKIALGQGLVQAVKGAGGKLVGAGKKVVGGVGRGLRAADDLHARATGAISSVTGIPDPNALARGIRGKLFGQ